MVIDIHQGEDTIGNGTADESTANDDPLYGKVVYGSLVHKHHLCAILDGRECPMTRSKRRLVFWLNALLLAVIPLSLASSVGAIDTSYYTQIWGARPSWYQYVGTRNYASAQDPYIASHAIQPWAANPNGMIDTATSAFFEAGNIKICMEAVGNSLPTMRIS